jgi:hypothetical protein
VRLELELRKDSRKVRPKIFVSEPLQVDLKLFKKRVYRADLEFDGIDHSGASYEGRVFINNPRANHDTAKKAEAGYVGSLYIFGHGGCFGDLGHCDVQTERRPYDFRSAHQLTPIKKRLIITEPLFRRFRNKDKLTVTIVPILARGMTMTNIKHPEDVIRLERISLIMYS